jgi:hypothetical protein
LNSLTIIPGTGELIGLRGTGSFAATSEPPYRITLEYDIAIKMKGLN